MLLTCALLSGCPVSLVTTLVTWHFGYCIVVHVARIHTTRLSALRARCYLTSSVIRYILFLLSNNYLYQITLSHIVITSPHAPHIAVPPCCYWYLLPDHIHYMNSLTRYSLVIETINIWLSGGCLYLFSLFFFLSLSIYHYWEKIHLGGFCSRDHTSHERTHATNWTFN